jgi:hypothetical protein
MMHPGLNFRNHRDNLNAGIVEAITRPWIAGCLAMLLALSMMIATVGECAEVTLQTARQVAEQKMDRYVALHGNWNGSATPAIKNVQTIEHDGIVAAYNFTIQPSGYILVAVDDELSPVQLYSTRSSFIQERVADINAVESWMIPFLAGKVRSVQRRARSATAVVMSTAARTRIRNAWDYLAAESDVRSAGAVDESSSVEASLARGAIAGPLLETAWGQDAPYNLQTPPNSCNSGENTLTGCVATAWAQLMRYWEWPAEGTGSHSYKWNGRTILADFNVTYRWDNMPGTINASSSAVQKQAVAQLIYHVAVAADMDFGCAASSSMAWADNVLDTYFKYKAMNFYGRSAYTAEEWFAIFKTEIDAGRPVIFSIFVRDENDGHEVVVDGYDDDPTAMVHINFGWSGMSDAYYDITNDDSFSADNGAGYDWDTGNRQYIVTNIEPNNDPRPTTDAGMDQVVNEGDTVHLSGSATPAGVAIDAYQWLQVGILDTNYDNLSVPISGSSALNASFTAPSVSSDTDLIFILKATDANRSVGFDKVTVTVRDTGSSSHTSTSSSSRSSGGGGGGCFIVSLRN